MKRKKNNSRFIITGLLLIAAALFLTVYNLLDDLRAKDSAADVVAQLEQMIPQTTEGTPAEAAPEETTPPETSLGIPEQVKPVKVMPVKTINGQNYIGTLEIPRHDLSLPIISQWSYPKLKIAPCRYKGSVYTDDLIISAHNYISHFGLIVELELGDEVRFTDVTGNTYRYQVVHKENLEATDIEKMSAGEWDLTLFTCTVGGTYRVTVRFERIKEEKAPEEEAVTLQSVPEDIVQNAIVETRVSPQEETEPAAEPTQEPQPAQEEQEPKWDTIPLYFQNDYPNTMYGSGTIESSGCSITALAMVASYMTEHEYLPDELARYFGGRAENNIARLETGSETLQLAFKKSQNWDYTYAGLQEGKIAIALMESNSLFTNTQHFIVLSGLTEDGKVLVNDPNRDNYDNWLLRDSFANGFEPKDILLGYSGAWLYDKVAMPDEPYIHFEKDLDRSNPRYPQIELTAGERKLLARVVWAEARGESPEGQQAVAEVVLNRMASENFPADIYEVIYGKDQFRTVPILSKAEPNQTQYDAIDRAIYGPYVLPEDVFFFATFATNDNIWGSIGGHIFCYAED